MKYSIQPSPTRSATSCRWPPLTPSPDERSSPPSLPTPGRWCIHYTYSIDSTVILYPHELLLLTQVTLLGWGHCSHHNPRSFSTQNRVNGGEDMWWTVLKRVYQLRSLVWLDPNWPPPLHQRPPFRPQTLPGAIEPQGQVGAPRSVRTGNIGWDRLSVS